MHSASSSHEDVRVLRLYADEAGASHFEEVEVALELALLGDATVIAVVSGDETGDGSEPHPAPARQFTLSISGVLEVTTSDGDVRRIGAGRLLLLDDTTGKGHSTRARGEATFLVVRSA
jgi:hypothetical protein